MTSMVKRTKCRTDNYREKVKINRRVKIYQLQLQRTNIRCKLQQIGARYKLYHSEFIIITTILQHFKNDHHTNNILTRLNIKSLCLIHMQRFQYKAYESQKK